MIGFIGLILFFVPFIYMIVAIFRADTTNYYETEIARNYLEKGAMKLSSEVVGILLEEGYNPVLEKERFDSDEEVVTILMEDRKINIMFDCKNPQQFQAIYHTHNFAEAQREQIDEIVNRLNNNTRFAYLAVDYYNDVYSISDASVGRGANVKHILRKSLNEILSIDKQYWEMLNEEYLQKRVSEV